MSISRRVAAILVFVLAAGSALAAPAGKSKKKAKKQDPYADSKYKSYKVLTDEGRSYRYDSHGNPIRPKSEKKGKKKKEGEAGATPQSAPQPHLDRTRPGDGQAPRAPDQPPKP